MRILSALVQLDLASVKDPDDPAAQLLEVALDGDQLVLSCLALQAEQVCDVWTDELERLLDRELFDDL